MTGLPMRFMNPGELEAMVALVSQQTRVRTMVEFGVNEGRTAAVMLRAFPQLEKYIGIDVYPNYVTPLAVQRNEVPTEPGRYVKHDRRFNLVLREKGSCDLSPYDLPLIDVAFIDGDHSLEGVQRDTALVYSRLAPDGMVIWHDYKDDGSVDVPDVLHAMMAMGRAIHHVEGTWLAVAYGN